MINVNIKKYNRKTVNQECVKIWMDYFNLTYIEAVQVATLSNEDYKELLRGMMKWNEIIWKS